MAIPKESEERGQVMFGIIFLLLLVIGIFAIGDKTEE
jgi:hypothetical protein